METRANYALIGAFTLATIAAAFFFVFWFTGGNKASQRKTYEIVFTGSVSGLSRGSSVNFNGLRVGEVTQIDLMEEDPSRVAALVAISTRTPVMEDTRARLEFAGLTGVAAIALTGGSATAQEVKPKEAGGEAILYADRSDFQNLLESVTRLAAKADSVLERADQLLADGREPILGTVGNIQAFSKALADNSAGINAFLEGVGDLGRKIGPLTARLETLATDADGLVRAIDPAQVRAVVANVQRFSGALGDNADNVGAVLADAAALAKRLTESAGKLDGLLADAGGMLNALDRQALAGAVADAGTFLKSLASNAGGLDATMKDAREVAAKLNGSLDSTALKGAIANVERFTGTLAANEGNVNTLLSEAAGLARRLGETTTRLDNALSLASGTLTAFDGTKIAAAVDDAQRFFRSLGQNSQLVDSTLQNAEQLTGKLNRSADKVDGLLASAQSLIGNANQKGLFTDIADAAKSIRKLADNLDVRTKEITAGITKFTGPGLREYEALATEGRRAVNDINRAVRSLERNPQQFIFGAKPSIPEYSGAR